MWSPRPCSMCLGDLGLMLEDVGDDATSAHSPATHVSQQRAIAARGLMRTAWLVPIAAKRPPTPRTQDASTPRSTPPAQDASTHAHARIHAHQHTHEPAPPPALTQVRHSRFPMPRTRLVRGNSKVFQSIFFFLFSLHTGNVGRKEEVWDGRRTVGSGNNGWALT